MRAGWFIKFSIGWHNKINILYLVFAFEMEEKTEFDFPEDEPELQKDIEAIENAPDDACHSEKDLEEELKEMKKKVQ